MKKISVILAVPVVLNVMTFMKSFLYDSMIMFVISFAAFFVSIYADCDSDRNSRIKWRILASVVLYSSVLLYLLDTDAINRVMFTVMMMPSAAGAAMVYRLHRKTEESQEFIHRVNY